MFNRKLIVVLGISLLVIALCASIWWAYWRPWSVDQLIISPATTFIEEPLRPDGYPDYVEALNEQMSEGVTPEINAAVLVLRAMGPKDIEEDARREFFTRLGIPPISPMGNYFEPWDAYAKRIAVAEGPKDTSVEAGNPEDVRTDMYDQGVERPWSRQEFPHLASWLESNERELEMLVAASKLPRFYEPAIPIGDRKSMYNVSLSLINTGRVASQALVARAMLRLGEGQVELAWDDLMACRRLGRLVGQGSFLVELLVCYAMDEMGVAGQAMILGEADLTAEQCAAMQKQLDELPALPPVVNQFDFGERLGMLDIVLTIARDGPKAFAELQGNVGTNPLATFSMRGGDWNVALVMVNEWMNRFVAAARIEDPTFRAAEGARIEAEFQAMMAEVKQPKRVASSFVSREAASERNAKMIVGLLFPALTAVFQAESRTRTRQEVLRVGVTLARYKAENGDYPDTLEALVPKYLKTAPTDWFARTPLVYKKRTNGYLLYSLGANQVDDGGRGYDQDADDLVIRVRRKVKDEGRSTRRGGQAADKR